MRRLPNQTVWLLLTLAGFTAAFACGGEDDPPVCENPPFIPGLDPAFAPCGCDAPPAEDGHSEEPWLRACLDAEGGMKYGCWAEGAFNMCAKACNQDAECPPYEGKPTLCSGFCIIPCDDGVCPNGLYCMGEDLGCVHDFSPKDS